MVSLVCSSPRDLQFSLITFFEARIKNSPLKLVFHFLNPMVIFPGTKKLCIWAALKIKHFIELSSNVVIVNKQPSINTEPINLLLIIRYVSIN